jgi:ribosome-binding factor A
MSDGRRQRRVAETIKKHVAEALARELFDPRLAALTVTRVDLGADLSYARIFLRKIAGKADAALQKEVEAAANHAAPVLRQGLAARLGLRRMPDLRFSYDSAQDALDRIESVLEEIERERGPGV